MDTLGVTFGVGKKWNLGFIVNRRSDMWENFRDTSNNLFPGNSSPIVPFMGLIGTSVNKNFHIGLAPYVAMWSRKGTSSDTTATNTDASSNSMGANLGFIYMIKKGWVEGNFTFRMNKYKSESTTGSVHQHLKTMAEFSLALISEDGFILQKAAKLHWFQF